MRRITGQRAADQGRQYSRIKPAKHPMSPTGSGIRPEGLNAMRLTLFGRQGLFRKRQAETLPDLQQRFGELPVEVEREQFAQ